MNHEAISLGDGKSTILDKASLPVLGGLNWTLLRRYGKRASHTVYAKAFVGFKDNKRVYVLMHRLITACPKKLRVDHINGNGLDNRLENLRFCNNSENVINQGTRSDNKSGQRGVRFDKRYKSWVSSIQKKTDQGVIRVLRAFKTFGEAKEFYEQTAKSLFGTFYKESK